MRPKIGLTLVQIFSASQILLHYVVALQYFAYSLQRDVELGVEYRQVIDHSVQYVWRYSYDRRNRSQVEGDTFVVQTQVEQPSSSTHSPLTFEVRYLHQSLEWSLPIKSSSGRIYRRASKTLCSDPVPHYPTDYDDYDYFDEATVQVTVSTRSKSHVAFTLQIAWANNTIRSFEKSVQTQISPTSQNQYRLLVPANTFTSRYALLYISSTDNVCTTVSIKHSTCPTGWDKLDNFGMLPHIHSQHTMTRKSAVTLKREDLLKGSLLLTFTVHEDSSFCGVPSDKIFFPTFIPKNSTLLNPSMKNIEFTLFEKIGDDAYLFATTGTFLCLLAFCIGFGFLFWTRFRMVSVALYFKQHKEQQISHHPNNTIPCGLQPTVIPITTVLPPGSVTVTQEKVQVQDEDLCCMFFLVATSYPQQSKHKRYLQNNCRKCERDIAKSSRRYVSTLSVVAAFYMLPVLQFVLLYQQVLNETGNEDLCYYNFMCLHPLGNLTTFNHMFSNIGYVMLGLLFICIVHVEQNRKWDDIAEQSEQHQQQSEKGLHSHYGIFYAMGIALAMEGLMSAFYHICPNRLNYQFDMCFMYVTTMLCLVKLYQGRHPDSNASALMSYGSLAIVVLLVAAGVLFQTWYFWCLINLIHFAVVFVMSLHLYSLGDWRIGWPAFNKLENTGYILSSIFHPFLQNRIGWMTIFLVFINLANWFAAGLGYILFFSIHDIASHLVFILLINLLMYSLIYLFLKIKYNEKVLWPTWLYVALSIPFWFIGLYLFILRRVDGWHLSQAESRNLNEECILWDFYDWHDIWHFLSAFGIFFMFMFFFTLDDDLRNVKRTNIKVF